MEYSLQLLLSLPFQTLHVKFLWLVLFRLSSLQLYWFEKCSSHFCSSWMFGLPDITEALHVDNLVINLISFRVVLADLCQWSYHILFLPDSDLHQIHDWFLLLCWIHGMSLVMVFLVLHARSPASVMLRFFILFVLVTLLGFESYQSYLDWNTGFFLTSVLHSFCEFHFVFMLVVCSWNLSTVCYITLPKISISE